MNILVIAPHRDDELLGVGGTILKRKAMGHQVSVCVVTARHGQVLPESTQRLHREMEQAHAYCKVDRYIGLPFAAVKLEDYPRVELNKALYDVIASEKPDEVYIPFWGDMQKDHQEVASAAMVALRCKYDHGVKRIYAYETLSETGINLPLVDNQFNPTVFEDISDYLEEKKTALSFYQSQMHPFPDLRSLEAIEALAKFRGATVNVRAAEAFMLVREVK